MLFVILNLISVFTLRGIMNSLYENIKNSIKYFLYKESEIEKYELTDFESLYNSSYNFYNQYFNDIAQNRIDFDLIMFWDFIGSLFYNCFNFVITSIIFFLTNSLLLLLIYNFDFLDIDKKTHKYSFFHLLYIIIVYFLFWISVSASALLSHQIYFDSFQIFNKKLKEEEEKKYEEKKSKQIKEEQKENKLNEIKDEAIKINNNIQKNSETDNTSNEKNKNINKINKQTKNKKTNEKQRNYNFFIISVQNFIAFFINYIINRKIYKYRNNYISKELENINKEEALFNIISKDKKICRQIYVFYAIGIVSSLLIYLIFYFLFFEKKKIDKKFENSKKKEENDKENNDNLIIKQVSFKKICGYVCFQQTILVKKEENPKINCCIECFILLFKSIKQCCINSFSYLYDILYYECDCKCCDSKCCDCKCCNNEKVSFEQKEREFCICYQEKRKLKWFNDYITSETQKILVQIVFLIGLLKGITIGLEVIYEEKYEKNFKNLTLPLFLSFLIYFVITLLFYFILLKRFSNPVTELLSYSAFASTSCFFLPLIIIFSIILRQ